MKPNLVVLSLFALQDLDEILSWLVKESGPARAERILNDLLKSLQSLEHLTNRGAKVRDADELSFINVRQIIKHGYRIVYDVRSDVVRVHAVIHERRSLVDLLKSRLSN